MKEELYDIAIVGGGISGTALAFVLTNYTNIKKIALIEKYNKVGLVNSNKKNNSQTLHFGDIETNYSLEKARKVKRAATLVKNYLLDFDKKREIYDSGYKMVLAVGDKEVKEMEKRYNEFKELFPKLEKINREQISKIEPKVVEGRDKSEEIIALYTKEGYTMDFGKLSESFVKNSKKGKIDIKLGKKVSKIERIKEVYEISFDNEKIKAKTIAVTAGAHSLVFAKSLGYGKEYSLLMVSGNFYQTKKILNGKVYTVQDPKLPFAAVHGDPEVHEARMTRFGPTAKTLLMLERRDYSSVIEYFKVMNLSLRTIRTFFSFLSDKVVFNYIFRNNILYEIPFIGKSLFVNRDIKKIIPSIKVSDLKKAKGYGGVRPQIVNLKTRELQLGEAKIIGENIIFNMTPSPGASTCLRNAEDDTKKIVEFLGKKYEFDKKKFEKDFEDYN